jgi:hypothetical protein
MKIIYLKRKGDNVLKLGYCDDKKEKMQSHEMLVLGIEDAIHSHLAGYGRNKEEATGELLNEIDNYIHKLHVVISELERLKLNTDKCVDVDCFGKPID